MPPVPIHLLPTLHILLLERAADGTFQRIGPAPAWVQHLWPEAVDQATDLRPAETFLFLEHFFSAAEAVWQGDAPGPLVSELWTKEDATGSEWLLEAQALHFDGQALLMIKFPTVSPDNIREVLQQSRELSLEQYRLRKKIDQREVLLHCMVHDLSTPLAAIRGSFRLMREEALVVARGTPLLDIGLRQVEKTQQMVKSLLADFKALQQPARPTPAGTTPDLAATVRDLARGLGPIAFLKRVQFRIETGDATRASWPVVAEQTRLERVLFNLFENALRHAPSDSDIVVRLAHEGTTVRFSIEDAGDGVPPAQVDHLFRKFAQGPGTNGKVGLGLYYCRITIDSWGGMIGYSKSPAGGACFWFRLPKPVNPT